MAAESIQILLAATKEILGDSLQDVATKQIFKESQQEGNKQISNNTPVIKEEGMSYKEFKKRFVNPQEESSKKIEEKQSKDELNKRDNYLKSLGNKALSNAEQIQKLLSQSLHSRDLAVADKQKQVQSKKRKTKRKTQKTGIYKKRVKNGKN
jgi:hypothetical protein